MTPRVGIDPSGFGIYGEVDRDEHTILCHECGERLAWLPNHLKHTHGMTSDEYRDKHGLARKQPLSSLELQRRRSAAAKAAQGTEAWARFQEAGEQALIDVHERLRSGELKPRISPAGVEHARLGRAESAREGRSSTRAQQWTASANEYLAFTRQNERLPRRRSDDAAERQHAEWMQRNRVLAQHGTLDDTRRAWLDEHLPGWNDWRTFSPPA
ncbi:MULTISPECIES: MucR family transcriptional regulator [unclassified Pseudoclavibacter]|uniref:MucR family transcriptional regulator n=1 Tax=unclassified Pseudoclavibacter TaxID=2615177 RepID=UPI00188A21CE|nr:MULTISPECIES: MucR family transcriptional regulator [unclassified Pseudoclavibacter]MBF4459464.1 MucR family transcriptional regulator [Pseudoclavibacter sp. VKM Ac-2867]MBF4549385.1 MucR family transcriptional regulator [Pseudoclavibacter sp. VKM Ac-2888]